VNPRASLAAQPVAAYARAVTDFDPGAPGGTPTTPPRHHRPWGWIAACGVLVLVAGGLAIWALGLQSDLDNQRDQTAQAQQQVEQAGADVKALEGEVEQISQSVSDAGDQLSQSGADAKKNAQQTVDGLSDKLESLNGQVQKAVEDAAESQDSAP
jgi:peptidoglycan hydrolase CwlO-like protein